MNYAQGHLQVNAQAHHALSVCCRNAQVHDSSTYNAHMDIGDVLRDFKKRTGMNDSQIAREVKVSQSTIQRLAKEGSRPVKIEFETLSGLRRFMRMTADQLMGNGSGEQLNRTFGND